VEIERDTNGDGTIESYIPMQNTNGSVIGIASSSGNLLEKVKYSSYGRPTFVYDNVNPQVDQVRVVSGDVYIRFSEKVDQTKAESAVKVREGVSDLSGVFTFDENDRRAKFTPSSALEGVSDLSGVFTFDENDRRAKFTPSSALPQSVTLTVVVTTDLEDTFGNTLETEFSQAFIYPGSDLLVYDRVSPEVEVVNLVNDEFIVEFDEEIDAASITGSIDLTYSSGTITGTVTQVDDKTLKFDPGSTLSDSVEYTINVKTTLTDLSGKNLNDTFSEDFIHTDNDLLIYEKPAPSEHTESAISNTVLFHGRNYEPETGLYYFRARYYHPKLGRFLQTDPMGYEDSMNLYQAFNNNAINFTDPFGEKTDINSFPEYVPFQKKRYKVSFKEVEYIVDFLEKDWKKTKIQVGSWFEDPTNFVEYSAYWLEDYGKHVPGLGAGIKMGTAAHGTTVTGERINVVERSNRLLWGGFEFAFLWAGAATEPKPVTVRNKTSSGTNPNQPKQTSSEPTPSKGNGVYPEETPEGIIWRNGETGAVTSPPSQGKTVVGHNPKYADKAEEIGANYFKITQKMEDSMTQKEIWALDELFVKEAVKRGDEIIFANKLINIRSFFTRELHLFRRLGVDVDEIIKSMLK
jgi:RHS repeat-associated protein